MYIICHQVAYNLYNLSDMGSIVFVAVFNGYDGVEATSHYFAARCCQSLHHKMPWPQPDVLVRHH